MLENPTVIVATSSTQVNKLMSYNYGKDVVVDDLRADPALKYLFI